MTGTSGLRSAFGDTAASPPRTSLADFVVARLRTAIAEGDLAPGQELPETEVASLLGVSRGPVREALATLEREGLVQLQRHRRARVSQLSREDVDEVYTLRIALESLAVARAARLARPEHIAALDLVVERLGELTPSSTPKQAAAVDLDFHDAIYQAAAHTRLQRAWVMLRPQVHMFLLSRNLANRDFSKIAVIEHAEIRDVIAARDADAAVAIIRGHLDGAYRRLLADGSFD